MKWLLLLALALTSLTAFASELHLNCNITQNTKVIAENSVVISEGQKNVLFGDFEEFEFFISSMGADRYELQALNKMEPSRSYATGHLNATSRELELSLWTREFLMETKCWISTNG
jgi:hypothetical protein